MRTDPLGTVVLIPIRSFDDAKSRLAEVLSPQDRVELSRWMAGRVVTAAGDLPVRVVTDDIDVAAWARSIHAGVVAPGVRGLNASVQSAASTAGDLGYTRILIAHADLPDADDLDAVDGPGFRIVADRHGDGSNVVSLPTGTDFRFAYGPGSLDRHRREAARVGLEITELPIAALAWDVDGPDDLPDDWRARIAAPGRDEPTAPRSNR